MKDHKNYDVNCPKCGHEFVYSVEQEPVFGEKKVWKAYLVLDFYAKKRDYAPLGFGKCISYLIGYINVSDNVARKMLKKMALEPYCFIGVRNGQITVKPKEESKKVMESIPDVLEVAK
ncbi:MAG: hypothetical protein KAJ44_01680 [Thermoplasmatales archaeon]|nr:hypothetical protein [Thermoplasmatales archaeon]